MRSLARVVPKDIQRTDDVSLDALLERDLFGEVGILPAPCVRRIQAMLASSGDDLVVPPVGLGVRGLTFEVRR